MKKILIIVFMSFAISCFSQITKNYTINGISRKAVVYEPKIKSDKISVIFVFHGHGGNANFVSRKIDIQNYYKEALVIFMEGYPEEKFPA